jgi:heme/copper-type cytochrome/quinol oxidase subunit 2
MSSAFAGLLAKTAAEEGRDVILSMLVVGLIFLAVIALGELVAWRHRRSARH